MTWILFYYNSLPDMPEGCPRFSSEVMHRDFFKCNPTNTGHYEYPRFETLSYDQGCHQREVEKFLKLTDPDRYVIFYTRHTYLNRKRKPQNKVVGYFKVPEDNKDIRGFRAFKKDIVLLKKSKCIPIRYKSRGVPWSEGKSKVIGKIDKIFKELKNKKDSEDNIWDQYRKETKTIMAKLKTLSQRKKFIDSCEACGEHSCYWGCSRLKIKEKRMRKLYGRGKIC